MTRPGLGRRKHVRKRTEQWASAPADLMGRSKPKTRKVHAAFADGRGGLVCGRDTRYPIAATPAEVTCMDCLACMERHPGTFPAWKPPAGWDSPAPRERACRVCGCTDEDCSGCIERTGEPCSWVEKDLCSACVGGGG
jgi:hypothetical protein